MPSILMVAERFSVVDVARITRLLPDSVAVHQSADEVIFLSFATGYLF